MIKFVIYKHKNNSNIKKWYDTFYGKMFEFECDSLIFNYQKERYIKLNNGNVVSYDDAVEKILKNRHYTISKQYAGTILKNNYKILETYRMKPQPIHNKSKFNIKEEVDKFIKSYKMENFKVEDFDDKIVCEMDEREMDDLEEVFSYMFIKNNIKYQVLI